MSSTAHIYCEQPVDRNSLSGSGNWTIDNGTHTLPDLRVAPMSRRLIQLAAVAFFWAVSSMSSGPDPWSLIQHEPSQLTRSSTIQGSSRRRLTPLEARRLALEILRRAEAGREAAAEAEARRGIDWEEMS